MRKALLYIHLWAGLTAAIFLLLLGVSGAALAFEDEIDRALNAKLAYVRPQSQSMRLDVITQKLMLRYPGARIQGFELPQRPDVSMFVGLTDASGKRQALFVDPYTGEVLGHGEQANQFMAGVHRFHTHLVGGEVGKQVLGWSAILLLALSITGIVLWWPAKLFRLHWSGSGRRFNFELHNSLGILSSIFLFSFAWTGVCIHWERPVQQLAQKISPAPEPRPAAPQIPAPGTRQLSADRLLEIARGSLPGAAITDLELPRSAKDAAQLALKFPEDHTPIGRSRMRIDGYSGKVLQLQSSRDLPAAMKYARMWNRELHTGDVLGLPTRILAAFFSLMLPLLAITGPMIWWNRRRVGDDKIRDRRIDAVAAV